MNDKTMESALAEAIYSARFALGMIADDINHEYGAAVIMASLKASRITLVELPDRMADRSTVAPAIRSRPMWASGDAWAMLPYNDTTGIEIEALGQEICGYLPSSNDARDLAAVLLAAADVAEHANA